MLPVFRQSRSDPNGHRENGALILAGARRLRPTAGVLGIRQRGKSIVLRGGIFQQFEDCQKFARPRSSPRHLVPFQGRRILRGRVGLGSELDVGSRNRSADIFRLSLKSHAEIPTRTSYQVSGGRPCVSHKDARKERDAESSVAISARSIRISLTSRRHSLHREEALRVGV